MSGDEIVLRRRFPQQFWLATEIFQGPAASAVDCEAT
jgi:hypothetical protein